MSTLPITLTDIVVGLILLLIATRFAFLLILAGTYFFAMMFYRLDGIGSPEEGYVVVLVSMSGIISAFLIARKKLEKLGNPSERL